MECKFNGSESGEKEMVKVENQLVPPCDGFWYLQSASMKMAGLSKIRLVERAKDR